MWVQGGEQGIKQIVTCLLQVGARGPGGEYNSLVTCPGGQKVARRDWAISRAVSAELVHKQQDNTGQRSRNRIRTNLDHSRQILTQLGQLWKTALKEQLWKVNCRQTYSNNCADLLNWLGDLVNLKVLLDFQLVRKASMEVLVQIVRSYTSRGRGKHAHLEV
ncbi:hypothetical protein BsWGS_17987 [Bradybaena similaris]